jgi:hypothetical protein
MTEGRRLTVLPKLSPCKEKQPGDAIRCRESQKRDKERVGLDKERVAGLEQERTAKVSSRWFTIGARERRTLAGLAVGMGE